MTKPEPDCARECPGFVGLRDHLERLFEAKIEGVREATAAAKIEMDRRMQEHNNLLKFVKDSLSECVSRNVYVMGHERVAEDIRVLQMARAEAHGKASMTSVYIAYVIALTGVMIAIVDLIVGVATK